MSVVGDDLWTLTSGRPEIDPDRLAAAVERQALEDGLDFRTRLLIRDSVHALAVRWGSSNVQAWLARSPARDRIEAISRSDLGPAGFPSLRDRIMPATRPEVVLQYLRELGTRLRHPAKAYLGGSASLIVAGVLTRQTEDVDFADEVPQELREQQDLLEQLSRRYGLRVAHFQSHYLPAGWAGRCRSLGAFGRLEVFAVDPYDVFVGKLFSSREKDRDDLRALSAKLDKAEIVMRVTRDGATFAGEQRLREAAAANWYVVFGEPLPA